MKILNVLFYAIPKSQYEFVTYRHKIDSIAFEELSAKYIFKYFKLHEPDYLPTNYTSNEYYFKGRNRFFHFPLRMYLSIMQEKPDAVFLHSFIFPFQVLFLRLFISKHTKIIIQHHAEKPFVNRIKYWFQKLAYSRVNAFLFSSSDLAQQYLDEGIIKDKSKVHEVMEGSCLFLPKDKMAARRKLGIEEENLFLWVGRLNENKDPLLVLSAFRAYKNKNADFKLYMIYGTFEMESEVKKFISGNGMENNVQLVGRVQHQDLEDWYSAADYFIAASHYEGSGIAMCESMACGCIPIVTAIPSFRTMIKEGNCGYLFQPGNADELLTILLNLNFSEKERLKEKVLEQFNNELSLKAIGRKIERIILNLSNK
jgi:glycosyltransferase involved in cell wall biosynthesis